MSNTNINGENITPLSQESREKQLINAAYNQAEKELLEGKASKGVMLHFLREGSSRNKAELERLKQENELLKAKIEQLQSQKRREEFYKTVLDSFKKYNSGVFDYSEDDDEDDE